MKKAKKVGIYIALAIVIPIVTLIYLYFLLGNVTADYGFCIEDSRYVQEQWYADRRIANSWNNYEDAVGATADQDIPIHIIIHCGDYMTADLFEDNPYLNYIDDDLLYFSVKIIRYTDEEMQEYEEYIETKDWFSQEDYEMHKKVNEFNITDIRIIPIYKGKELEIIEEVYFMNIGSGRSINLGNGSDVEFKKSMDVASLSKVNESYHYSIGTVVPASAANNWFFRKIVPNKFWFNSTLTHTVEIDYIDEDGNVKTLTIELETEWKYKWGIARRFITAT